MNPTITDMPRDGYDTAKKVGVPTGLEPKSPQPPEPWSTTDNFEVQPGESLFFRGKMYRHPDILWGLHIDTYTNLATCVSRGVVKKTLKPRTVQFDVPQPKTETDPAPLMGMEINRLQSENDNLAAGNKSLVAQLNELKAQSDGRIRALGELTDKAAHWQATAELGQARIAELESEVARLTADLEAMHAAKKTEESAANSDPAKTVKTRRG